MLPFTMESALSIKSMILKLGVEWEEKTDTPKWQYPQAYFVSRKRKRKDKGGSLGMSRINNTC